MSTRTDGQWHRLVSNRGIMARRPRHGRNCRATEDRCGTVRASLRLQSAILRVESYNLLWNECRKNDTSRGSVDWRGGMTAIDEAFAALDGAVDAVASRLTAMQAEMDDLRASLGEAIDAGEGREALALRIAELEAQAAEDAALRAEAAAAVKDALADLKSIGQMEMRHG